MDLQTLPLFPLASVVLMPRLEVPLYIFEPRYREMTEHALADARQIGMVAVRPEHLAEMGGDPPLYEVGCTGRIRHSKQRPDGTFEIRLVGTARFRIIDEAPRPPDRLYRVARVQMLDREVEEPSVHSPGLSAEQPSGAATRPALRTARAALLEHLESLLHHSKSDDDPSVLRERFDAMEDEELVNALSLGLGFSVADQQQLLEAPHVLDRYALLNELIEFRTTELRHELQHEQRHRGSAKSDRLH